MDGVSIRGKAAGDVSSAVAKAIVWDGQCMTNPSMSSFTGSSAGLSHSFCSCLPQLGGELSGNSEALAL